MAIMTHACGRVGAYDIVPNPARVRLVDVHPILQDGTYNEQVDEWMTKHAQLGTEYTVTKTRFDGVAYQEPLRHWHPASLATLLKKALTLTEDSMYNVIMTTERTTAVVAGPYEEVDAQFHRKRLAEQHPESVFTVEPDNSDA